MAKIAEKEAGTMGCRLRLVRDRASQIAFSKRLGVDQSTIRRYEGDERSPDIKFITRVAAEFDVSPTWLLCGAGPMRLSTLQEGTDSAGGSFPTRLINDAVCELERWLLQAGVVPPPENKGILVVQLLMWAQKAMTAAREAGQGQRDFRVSDHPCIVTALEFAANLSRGQTPD